MNFIPKRTIRVANPLRYNRFAGRTWGGAVDEHRRAIELIPGFAHGQRRGGRQRGEQTAERALPVRHNTNCIYELEARVEGTQKRTKKREKDPGQFMAVTWRASVLLVGTGGDSDDFADAADDTLCEAY